ncbi:MAG: SDR family oxidoreductase [Chloroherpetonaceae bacterium]|nr:SDR family oxidoreductase [Chloroherpetonaceae bacterium]
MCILITGAGKGIGKAIAIEFAKKLQPNRETKLFLTSRTESDLISVKKICESYGAEVDYLVSDLSTTNAAKATFNIAINRFQQINCLVNNAGVGRFKSLFELTEDDYNFTMDTNLKATFFLTQLVFQSMQSAKNGHIFFITSIAAEKPFEQSALYCMSKFGQKGFVEVLRLYAQKCNVRITNVMPGAVFTPMWGEEGIRNEQRMMMPEDIAEPIVQAYYLPTRTSIEEIVLRPIAGDL